MPRRSPSCQGSFIMVINSLHHFFATAGRRTVHRLSGFSQGLWLHSEALQHRNTQVKTKKKKTSLQRGALLLPDPDALDVI